MKKNSAHYRFCFGPWNLSEGADPYGPPTRPAQSFDWKLAQMKKLGFDAMMFHDDDAVPDIDTKSSAQVLKEAKELERRLDGEGIAAEMVAPRLWFAPQTVDGGYTSNDPKHRRYAIDRSKQTIDIARVLGTDDLRAYLTKYGLELDPQLEALVGRHARKPYERFVTPDNRHLAHPAAISFLDGLLKYDHAERLTAKEAMAHPYFEPVRAAEAEAAAAGGGQG